MTEAGHFERGRWIPDPVVPEWARVYTATYDHKAAMRQLWEHYRRYPHLVMRYPKPPGNAGGKTP